MRLKTDLRDGGNAYKKESWVVVCGGGTSVSKQQAEGVAVWLLLPLCTRSTARFDGRFFSSWMLFAPKRLDPYFFAPAFYTPTPAFSTNAQLSLKRQIYHPERKNSYSLTPPPPPRPAFFSATTWRCCCSRRGRPRRRARSAGKRRRWLRGTTNGSGRRSRSPRPQTPLLPLRRCSRVAVSAA